MNHKMWQELIDTLQQMHILERMTLSCQVVLEIKINTLILEFCKPGQNFVPVSLPINECLAIEKKSNFDLLQIIYI